MRYIWLTLFLTSCVSAPLPDYGQLIHKAENPTVLTCEEWLRREQVNLIDCQIHLKKLEDEAISRLYCF